MTDIIKQGRVIKNESGLYLVDVDGAVSHVKSRGKNKKESIVVGDLVDLENVMGEYVISRILDRKNHMYRPSVANIDQIIYVMSEVPEADFFVADKLIINCFRQKIDIIICINKSDLGGNLIEKARDNYGKVVNQIISSSALGGKTEEIKAVLPGKLTCFAGQSAVGKSTIVNEIAGADIMTTGAVSNKTGRGKNTTTSSELLIAENGYIIDTPGFSLLELINIQPEEISLYYPDFLDFSSDCRYNMCTHTHEPHCAVAAAAEGGGLNAERYNRYLKIYSEIKADNDKEYSKNIKYKNYRKTQK